MLNPYLKYQVQKNIVGNTRSCVRRFLKDDLVGAAEYYEKVFKESERMKFPPTLTRLAISEGCNEALLWGTPLERKEFSVKAQAFGKFIDENINSEHLKAAKKFDEQYTKLYPKTAEIRETLIKEGKVKLPELNDLYSFSLAHFGPEITHDQVRRELSSLLAQKGLEGLRKLDISG